MNADINFRALIVDDEEPARQRLARLLDHMPQVELVGEAANGEQALELLQTLQPSIIFLDISMPVMNGMQLATIIAEQFPHIHVIFTTAYDEYAIKAFDVNAKDYLLKPIRKERLAQSINKLPQPDPSRPFITIKHKDALHRIFIEQIIYLHADQKYTEVFTKESYWLITDSLKDMEEKYSHFFIRIHRSTLVNKHYFTGIELDKGKMMVILKDSDARLEVSRRHHTAIRRFINSHH